MSNFMRPRNICLWFAVVIGLGHVSVSAETPWEVHDVNRPLPDFVETIDAGNTKPSPAPSDAIVLFDGENLDAWTHPDGSEPRWEIQDGVLIILPQSGSLQTKQAFGSIQMHLEWRTPADTEADDSGQSRGNSGLFLMKRYEIQILETRENRTYADGMAGALYGQHPPLINAGRGLGHWQTYDIVFTRPEFDTEGKVVRPARITAFHNGVLIHHEAEFLGQTTHKREAAYTPHADRLPLMLQDHRDSVVHFRNIWVRPLGQTSK